MVSSIERRCRPTSTDAPRPGLTGFTYDRAEIRKFVLTDVERSATDGRPTEPREDGITNYGKEVVSTKMAGRKVVRNGGKHSGGIINHNSLARPIMSELRRENFLLGRADGVKKE